MINLKKYVINAKRGKYVRKNSIEPVGTCDYSGFLFSKSNLVKQKEWRGNELVWTGAMVGRPFVDEPNQQNRPPQIKDDPRIVRDPRPEGIVSQQSPDATGNNSPSILEIIVFTGENLELLLPNFAGEDIGKLSDRERLKLLHFI